MPTPELKDIYQLIKNGDKDTAREQLVPYLEDNPEDYNAWWLMANAVADPQLRQESLQRVLEINPTFEPAQKALAKMTRSATPNGDKPKNGFAQMPEKSKRGGETLYVYPLRMRFKVIALAPQIYITDANDAPVLFVRQKIFNLKEDVRIFRDDSKTDEVFRINADRIIDLGARYNFTDSKTERPLGSIKQRGLKTIWKAHYDIEAPDGTAEHALTEDNPWVKVADALLGEIPFLGLAAGYFIHPSYTIHDANEIPILQLKKEPAFFESKFRIDLLETGISAEEEKRLLLGVMMMIQLNRARG